MKKHNKTYKIEPIIRNPTQLGIALQRFRKQKDWTQVQTGEKSGLKQAMISQIESGASGTQLATLFKHLAGLELELIVRSRKKTNFK